MSEALKVLGQVNPAANTNTDLYTVPGATQAQVSTITICNTGSGTALFRIAVRPAGAALATLHYQYYDVQIQGTAAQGDSFQATLGWTLAATDVVTVRSDSSNLAFSLFGMEVA